MAEVSYVGKAELSDVDVMSSSLRVPDVRDTAGAILKDALAAAARKADGLGHQEALDALRCNDKMVWGYFNHSVATALAEHLGAFDNDVNAVYVFGDDATPEDSCFDETPWTPLIHLLVTATRKTAALSALVGALDRALGESFANLLGRGGSMRLLDVQIIDKATAESRTGYGALLGSLHNKPVQLWSRS